MYTISTSRLQALGTIVVTRQLTKRDEIIHSVLWHRVWGHVLCHEEIFLVYCWGFRWLYALLDTQVIYSYSQWVYYLNEFTISLNYSRGTVQLPNSSISIPKWEKKTVYYSSVECVPDNSKAADSLISPDPRTKGTQSRGRNVWEVWAHVEWLNVAPGREGQPAIAFFSRITMHQTSHSHVSTGVSHIASCCFPIRG